MEKIQVHYEEGALEFAWQLFGQIFNDEDLAYLAGALDGATVNVNVSRQKNWLYLSVVDPSRFEVYETSIRYDAKGELYGYIHEVRTAIGQRGKGLGARAFLRQVNGAKALGLKRFELWAAGYLFDGSRNGYYTWARFGFDATLTSEQKNLLVASLIGSETVNQVIANGGKDWWKRYGSDVGMIFDLNDESAMMRTFKQYCDEKGLLER